MLTLEEQSLRIEAILQSVYGNSPWTQEQIARDLTSSQTRYFYVYESDLVVGFLALQELFGESEITQLAVDRAYQGKGYGRQLLSKLADYPEKIFLEVRVSNHRAQALYQSFGFKEVGLRPKYYHHPVEDALLMVRDI